MTKNRAIKLSAFFFFLWGLLHFLVGYPALLYPFEGTNVVLDVFKINAVGNEGAAMKAAFTNATYLGLNFLINLMAFGLLGMWLGFLMWKERYVSLSYRLSLVILGIVDIAFIGCMVITEISPLSEAIWGPLLYVLGAVFGWYGVYSDKLEEINAQGRVEDEAV
ncbi:hypothetical protein [Flocculibacter collagenilyticus]|uniref:hypothetical protein n=1 Tax=Flocculibacter collagenilyticus TaxID=2744479 RepID=UPI0018F37A8A|nr:hypothetical protein [Flocculibacter collagenilyticus]